MTWAEFEKEWSRLRPPEDILDYYGSWPDGKKTREIIRL
jgi:acetophenone carboxylase